MDSKIDKSEYGTNHASKECQRDDTVESHSQVLDDVNHSNMSVVRHVSLCYLQMMYVIMSTLNSIRNTMSGIIVCYPIACVEWTLYACIVAMSIGQYKLNDIYVAHTHINQTSSVY